MINILLRLKKLWFKILKIWVTKNINWLKLKNLLKYFFNDKIKYYHDKINFIKIIFSYIIENKFGTPYNHKKFIFYIL